MEWSSQRKNPGSEPNARYAVHGTLQLSSTLAQPEHTTYESRTARMEPGARLHHSSRCESSPRESIDLVLLHVDSALDLWSQLRLLPPFLIQF